jgi:hypothetical protein
LAACGSGSGSEELSVQSKDSEQSDQYVRCELGSDYEALQEDYILLEKGNAIIATTGDFQQDEVIVGEISEFYDSQHELLSSSEFSELKYFSKYSKPYVTAGTSSTTLEMSQGNSLKGENTDYGFGIYERYITEFDGQIYTVDSTSHHVFKVEGCHLEFVRTLNQQNTNFNFYQIDGLYITQQSRDYEGGFDLYYLDEELDDFVDVVIPTQMSGKLRGNIVGNRLLIFSNLDRKLELYDINRGKLTLVSSKALDLEIGSGILYPRFDFAFGDIYIETYYYIDGEFPPDGNTYKWDLDSDELLIIGTYSIFNYENTVVLEVDGTTRLLVHGIEKELTLEESELIRFGGLRIYSLYGDIYISNGCVDTLHLFTELGLSPVSIPKISGCTASYLAQTDNGIVAFDVVETNPEELRLILYEIDANNGNILRQVETALNMSKWPSFSRYSYWKIGNNILALNLSPRGQPEGNDEMISINLDDFVVTAKAID